MPLSLIRPQPLVRIPEAFNDKTWFWELKFDGFRSLAYIESRDCRLVSRNGHVYKRFDPLRASLLRERKLKDAIVDGEVVCLDAEGRSVFSPWAASTTFAGQRQLFLPVLGREGVRVRPDRTR